MDAPSTVRDADGGSQGEAGASSGAWQRRHVPSLLVGLAWLLIIGSGLALHLAADAGGRHRWALPHTTPRLPSRRRLQQQLPKPGTFGGPGSCEESGMCSLGKLGVYVGEIDSTKGLKAALQAASYKNEVFLVVFGTINPEMAMNFGGCCTRSRVSSVGSRHWAVVGALYCGTALHGPVGFDSRRGPGWMLPMVAALPAGTGLACCASPPPPPHASCPSHAGPHAWSPPDTPLEPCCPCAPAAAEMWRVGLGNLMLMGANEAACSPVKTHFPNVTCVWSDAEWFPKNVSLPAWTPPSPSHPPHCVAAGGWGGGVREQPQPH